MVTIKSEREIELMREAGRILAKVHEELGRTLVPGMSTKEILSELSGFSGICVYIY